MKVYIQNENADLESENLDPIQTQVHISSISDLQGA